jgi:hypothetical protein
VIDSACTATVQELHLVALHLLCEAMDRQLDAGGALAAPPVIPAAPSGAFR